MTVEGLTAEIKKHLRNDETVTVVKTGDGFDCHLSRAIWPEANWHAATSFTYHAEYEFEKPYDMTAMLVKRAHEQFRELSDGGVPEFVKQHVAESIEAAVKAEICSIRDMVWRHYRNASGEGKLAIGPLGLALDAVCKPEPEALPDPDVMIGGEG